MTGGGKQTLHAELMLTERVKSGIYERMNYRSNTEGGRGRTVWFSFERSQPEKRQHRLLLKLFTSFKWPHCFLTRPRTFSKTEKWSFVFLRAQTGKWAFPSTWARTHFIRSDSACVCACVCVCVCVCVSVYTAGSGERNHFTWRWFPGCLLWSH